MDVLVTGAAGFVGPHLLRQLIAEGKEVGAAHLPREKAGVDGCEELDLDLMDEQKLRKLLMEHRPQQICHLAAQSSAALSRKEPELTAEVNVLGTIYLLEAIRSIPEYYPRILLTGSYEEYGPVKGSVSLTEEAPLRPMSVFAATKACMNMIGAVYARTYGMGIVMARSFCHIGVGQSPEFAVPGLAMQIAEMETGFRSPVLRVGNLNASRDLIDVRDVARAYVLLLKRGCAGETYNVGSGRAVRMQEVLDILLELTEQPIAVEQSGTPGRPEAAVADTAKLREDTGWEPEYSLRETLHTMLNHYRRSYGLL